MTQLQMTGPLGEILLLPITDHAEQLREQRAWGGRGYTPGTGEIPAGGFTLPYSMANTFDWAMLGASAFEIDGQHCVKHRGHTYKRRDFEARTTGVKMPASVKYSRGAKPTDPAHIKEGDEGGVQYVTLIQFRGNGRALTEYEVQRGSQPQQRAPQAAPEKVTSDETPAPETIGNERAAALHKLLAVLLHGTEYKGKHPEFISEALGRPLEHLADIRTDEAKFVRDYMEEYRAEQGAVAG